MISWLGSNVQDVSLSEKLAKPFPSTQLQVPRPRRLSDLLITMNLLREEISESKRGHSIALVLCPPLLLHACEVSSVTFLPINHAQLLSQYFSAEKCGNFKQEFILAELLKKKKKNTSMNRYNI